MPTPILSPLERSFVAAQRRATLATIRPDGRPRLVPICFVLGDQDDPQGRPVLYTPIDEKPKASGDPQALARVRDLLVLPDASVLVDRWSEDWDRLAWTRLSAVGQILEPQPHEREEHSRAVTALRAKYPQYTDQRLSERPMIRLAVTAALSWGDLGER
jgi:coenzyme F420-0:L-glutamate ligase/coenzyme F420-1:gamma-L-glutamate ligase